MINIDLRFIQKAQGDFASLFEKDPFNSKKLVGTVVKGTLLTLT